MLRSLTGAAAHTCARWSRRRPHPEARHEGEGASRFDGKSEPLSDGALKAPLELGALSTVSAKPTFASSRNVVRGMQGSATQRTGEADG